MSGARNERPPGHVSVRSGQGPFPFQLDTYASIDACIDDDLARQLKLVKTGTTLNSDGHTTSTKDIVRIDELRLGGATFRNLKTLVDDYDFLSTTDGRPVRGLLGFTLFRDLLLTVDYPGSRVLLTHGELTPGAEHVIPYTSPTGSPDVTLGFGDHDLTVGIDTGSGSALMLMYEDAGDLLLDGELRRTGQARTVYSSFDVYGAKLAQPVQFAGQNIAGLSASFSKQQRGRLCGFGLLQGFVLSFDQQHKLVRLERQLGP